MATAAKSCKEMKAIANRLDRIDRAVAKVSEDVAALRGRVELSLDIEAALEALHARFSMQQSKGRMARTERDPDAEPREPPLPTV
jgi:hypothetical protein